METLAIGLFLAAVNTKIIDWLAEPIRRKFPDLDMWWLLYVAALTGFVLAWLSGVNLFTAYIENDALGRILSGLLVGGGASLIHDIFDGPDIVELTAEIEPAE